MSPHAKAIEAAGEAVVAAVNRNATCAEIARAYLAALKVVEAARALDKVIAEFPDYPAAWAECIAAQETALAAYDKEAGR